MNINDSEFKKYLESCDILIECESPLEISDTSSDGSARATGWMAKQILQEYWKEGGFYRVDDENWDDDDDVYEDDEDDDEDD